MRQLESVLHELHATGRQSISGYDFLRQHRNGLGGHFPSYIARRLDGYYVLCAGCAQLLGLDLFRAVDCGMFYKPKVFLNFPYNFFFQLNSEEIVKRISLYNELNL